MFKKYILLLLCAAFLSAASKISTYTYKTVGDLQLNLDAYTPTLPNPPSGYPVFFFRDSWRSIHCRKQGWSIYKSRTA